MVGIQDSTTNHFGSLIRAGSKYIIPKFQRDYSWETSQWDDLWQDIETMYSEKGEHYMGYLVLQATKGKDYMIIDGQQRFTTISIIILAAIKAIKRFVEAGVDVDDNSKRLNTLKNTYIGNEDPVSLEYDNILILNRNNNNYYKDYIVKLGELKVRNTSYTEKLMKKCFDWYDKLLMNKFKTGKEYAEFITYIVDNLYFTIIKVSDEMNAFKVFETLNARGVQLSSADLLKNYLFSLVDNSDQYPDRIEILEGKWSYLTKNVQAEKLPDFIRYYWNSKNKIVRANELFKTIRQVINTDKEVFELINDMQSYSDVYMALRNPNDDLWHEYPNISRNIELLNLFGMKQPNSLLMAAYRFLSISEFDKVLDFIIKIGFRYSVICGKNPNEIERTYNNVAVTISTTKSFYVTLLKDVYIDDDEFYTTFCKKSFVDTGRNTKIIRYILGKYERFKGGTRDVNISSETDSIEHILPQNPGEEWGEDNYEYDSLIYRLGNLCLLEKSFNQNIENKSYKDKLLAYKQSAFLTTRSITENYNEWNSYSINRRQEYMGKAAISIWKIDF